MCIDERKYSQHFGLNYVQITSPASQCTSPRTVHGVLKAALFKIIRHFHQNGFHADGGGVGGKMVGDGSVHRTADSNVVFDNSGPNGLGE